MRQPFCILNVLGDVLDEGELRLVGAAKTLEAARRRIRALGQSHPGEFVIYNQQTGERVSMKAGAEKAGGTVAAAAWPRLLEKVPGEGLKELFHTEREAAASSKDTPIPAPASIN